MNHKILLSLVAVGALLVSPLGAAEIHTIDTAHSDASFQVRHLLSNVRGEFNDFSGTIVFDHDDPSASSVEFTVQAASIDTDNEERDQHLRSQDFFWVEEHPTLTFESTAVEKADEDTFKVTGDLTMRGVTKRIDLMVDYLGQATDPWGNLKAGFSTSTVLDRKEYGISWNKVLDNGGVFLGDDVTVSIDLETAVKAQEG